MSDIKDYNLSKKGKDRIDWAAQSMPVLKTIQKHFIKNRPLEGIRIAACLHVTTETAYLMKVLKDGGAEIALCASNPLSTQDDVAASLVVDEGINVFAIKGEDNKTYYDHINKVLNMKPNLTMDDGADLVSEIHMKRRDLLENIVGGTEETTTGVIRLRSMENDGSLQYPIIAVNDAKTKHLFDNRYGTGQSTIDGIIRATNRLIAGSNFVVAGYGWCGRGLAMRAKGMGANVIVTEIDPMKALEATMDGYNVKTMSEASKIGDFFCTVTGNINVVTENHFNLMKDGAIVCNSGHFNVELDLKGLSSLSFQKRNIREFLDEYLLPNGRRIYVIGEGRLVNLASAEGHPSSVMDMSFANQALCAEYMVKYHKKMAKAVFTVPEKIDIMIASLKLRSMGILIDKLSVEQEKYLNSWKMGT